MKAFSDLEQSKKLAEILPIESADMHWQKIYDENHLLSDYRIELLPFRLYSGLGVPAWSLAALLNYLKSKNKFPEIKELSDGRFALTTYIWDGEDCIQNSIGVTIVDACYEMIIKLHELNLL